MGDGTLIALWTAVFANKSETNKMWEFCADHIKIAGCHVKTIALFLYLVHHLYLCVTAR